jgi:hypothetical protein
VVDHDQQPLMPTTPARARRWIRGGKAAAFWKGGLFCVRLNVEPSAREIQPVACGIDPGSKKEGLVVASAAHTYLNLQADAVTWVKDAEAQSTRMRRTRRNRKTPCRQPRANRRQSKKKLPPSTKARWQWKLRLARFLCRLFPISVFVVEDVAASTRKGKKRWNRSFSPLQVGKHWFYEEIRQLAPLQLLRLHRLEPERGGKRKPYGGTLSLGIKRGTLVKHPKWGLAYVGGTMDGRISLHDPHTGKRLTQTAKVADCHRLALRRWRIRLLPLRPAATKGTPASSPD